MCLLFEVADKNLLLILFGIVLVIIFGVIVFYVVKKNNRVMPIGEEERFDAKEEPKELTEEQKAAKAELERVFNMMSADLEAANNEPSVIDEFEREQEENAIISYQELMRQAKAKGQIQESDSLEDYSSYERDFNVEKEFTEEDIYDFSEKEENEVYKGNEKKFKSSEFISPIFGIQGTSTSYQAIKKKEEPKEKHENDENLDFLNSLKEFRENL